MPDTSFTSFTLGKYRAVELLGKGGFGTVYRAIDTTLDREVALKVLHPQLVADPTFVERFRTEAKIIAALRHPNVVGVYELGEEAGRLFIAMEYMPGGTLKDRLAQRERLSFDETLTIMQQVCAGLDTAHAEGMLHRDIKPGNILFDKRGHAVVGDFGLARAMQLSSIASQSSSAGGVGTPFYKAPELWRGKPPASPATDVYALACMVYEMLTGRVLFGGDTPDEVITKHLVDGPDFGTDWPLADAPQGLAEVVQRGLARNPTERHTTAKAYMDALLSLRAHVATPTKQPVQSPQNNKSKLPVWGLAVAGLIVALLIGAMLVQGGNGNGSHAVTVATTQVAIASPTVAISSNKTATFGATSRTTLPATPTAIILPSETATTTPPPTPSDTPTFVPFPTPSNTPMPTVVVIRPSDTPISAPSPAEALKQYYSLLNNKEYDRAWSMFTPWFQQHQTAKSFDDYRNWAITINAVTITEPQMISQSDTEATVVIPAVSYHMQDNTTRDFNNLTFRLIRSAPGQAWLIDGTASN